MIVITGAAGFIGSCMLRKLNDEGLTDILLVDDFTRPDKNRNFEGKAFRQTMDRMAFPKWLDQHGATVELVIHMGARTDTTECDEALFERLNLGYSKAVWSACAKHEIPLLYASSAATYGLGELGYDDSHELVPRLRPLNSYGRSKNEFDKWALQQTEIPPQWYGFKFFNVYGPNEYHKGRMASVIFHTVHQIEQTGGMKLFRSHRPDFKDGEQKRDFVYVKDVVEVLWFFAEKALQPTATPPANGLYNLGTGQARTFLDLATHTFLAMNRQPSISFIDTPEDIRDTYQYFTQAKMDKLRTAGYDRPFHSLEDGIADYVRHYLAERRIW